MNCIDRVRRRNVRNRLRVIARPLLLPQLPRSSFEQIRYYERPHPDVLHLLEMLAMIDSHARRPCGRDAAREEAETVLQSSESGLPNARDRRRARASYEHVPRVLRGERSGEASPPLSTLRFSDKP